jgi:hypothetical protein
MTKGRAKNPALKNGATLFQNKPDWFEALRP